MLWIAEFSKFTGINICESKKSQKVTLHDLGLKVESETPKSFSLPQFFDIDCRLKAERRPTLDLKLVCGSDRRINCYWDR